MNTSIVKQEERCSETADMASNVRENALEWVHGVRALRLRIVGGADTRCALTQPEADAVRRDELAACRLQARFFAAAIEARRQAAQRAPRAGSGTVSWPPRWNCRALSFEKMCVGVGGSHFHVVEQQEVQRGRSGGADRRAGARRARRTRVSASCTPRSALIRHFRCTRS